MQALTSIFSSDTILTSAAILMAAFFATCIHFAMEPLRWKHAYLPHQSDRITINRARDALLATALASHFLPFKLGLPLRIVLLKKKADLATSKTVAILALDGMLSFVIWTITTASCIWLAALHWDPPVYVWLFAIPAAGGVIIITLLRKKRESNWIQQWLSTKNLFDRPARHAGYAATIILLDVLSYGLRHALLLWLVTGRSDLAVLGAAIGIVATFSGIISGLPMGILGYDASLIALLATLGIEAHQSATILILNRSMNLIVAACFGIPASIRLGLGRSLPSILRKLRETGNAKK